MARCYPAYLIGVIRFSLGDAVAFAQTSLPAETGASKALARSSFASCVQELAAQAQAKGIASEVIQQHLGGLAPDFDTLAGASSQPEFIKPIWDYLDATVSQTRINTGRSKLRRMGPRSRCHRAELRRRPPYRARDLGHRVVLRSRSG